jgi:hypothetical protein
MLAVRRSCACSASSLAVWLVRLVASRDRRRRLDALLTLGPGCSSKPPRWPAAARGLQYYAAAVLGSLPICSGGAWCAASLAARLHRPTLTCSRTLSAAAAPSPPPPHPPPPHPLRRRRTLSAAAAPSPPPPHPLRRRRRTLAASPLASNWWPAPCSHGLAFGRPPLPAPHRASEVGRRGDGGGGVLAGRQCCTSACAHRIRADSRRPGRAPQMPPHTPAPSPPSAAPGTCCLFPVLFVPGDHSGSPLSGTRQTHDYSPAASGARCPRRPGPKSCTSCRMMIDDQDTAAKAAYRRPGRDAGPCCGRLALLLLLQLLAAGVWGAAGEISSRILPRRLAGAKRPRSPYAAAAAHSRCSGAARRPAICVPRWPDATHAAQSPCLPPDSNVFFCAPDSSCYQHYSTLTTFAAAQAVCVDAGGDLVVYTGPSAAAEQVGARAAWRRLPEPTTAPLAHAPLPCPRQLMVETYFKGVGTLANYALGLQKYNGASGMWRWADYTDIGQANTSNANPYAHWCAAAAVQCCCRAAEVAIGTLRRSWLPRTGCCCRTTAPAARRSLQVLWPGRARGQHADRHVRVGSVHAGVRHLHWSGREPRPVQQRFQLRQQPGQKQVRVAGERANSGRGE